eukprot:12934293-Alexandrium_andersonii.AAC.1
MNGVRCVQARVQARAQRGGRRDDPGLLPPEHAHGASTHAKIAQRSRRRPAAGSPAPAHDIPRPTQAQDA